MILVGPATTYWSLASVKEALASNLLPSFRLFEERRSLYFLAAYFELLRLRLKLRFMHV